MAQMYHPDKVASLAPEYREIAERRMKEINAAYIALKAKGQTIAMTPPDTKGQNENE
jgi:preprotein translocase subunit Sec63